VEVGNNSIKKMKYVNTLYNLIAFSFITTFTFGHRSVVNTVFAMRTSVDPSLRPSLLCITPRCFSISHHSFERPNFLVLNLRVQPNNCIKERHPPIDTENLTSNLQYLGIDAR